MNAAVIRQQPSPQSQFASCGTQALGALAEPKEWHYERSH